MSARSGAFIVFVLLAAYSSYTDIAERKVKNRIIGLGLILPVSFLILDKAESIPLIPFMLNVLTGIASAVLLWKAALWAAGDAKFYLVSVLFSPLFSSPGSLPWAPGQIPSAILLLFNAFIIAFLFLILEIVTTGAQAFIRAVKAGKIRAAAYGLLPKITGRSLALQAKMFLVYLVAFVFFAVSRNLASRWMAAGAPGEVVFYCVLILLFQPARRYLDRLPVFFIIAMLALPVVLFRLDLAGILILAFKFFVFLSIINTIINRFLTLRELRSVPIRELTPRDLIAREEIARLPAEYSKEERFYADGLSVEQVRGIQEHFAKDPQRTTIRVYSTFPFVPAIALSAICVYFFGNRPINIFYFLYR